MMKFCPSFLASVVRFARTFSTSQLVCAAAFLAVLSLTPVANAVTLYWDANSLLAGTGTWDVNTTQNWKTTNTAGAPDAKWFPNDGTVDAAFGGAAGAGGSGLGGATGKVTVSGTVNVNSLIIQPVSGNYSLTGGTINIANPNSSIVMLTQTLGGAARAEMINSAISGTNITIVADHANTNALSARLDIGDNNSTANPNTFTGDLIMTGTGTGFNNTWEQINLNNSVALPSTATVRMKRDNVQLLFTAGGAAGTVPYTQTFNNNIILNDGIGLTSSGTGVASNGIGSANPGTVVTLNGVISGNSDLYFRVGANGGNGIMVLGNNETYTGNSYILTLGSSTGGAIRLATNNALPATTTLFFGGPTTNTANVGAFDMAGFNQKLAGINVTTTASLGGITSSGGTTSTLTIDGNVVGTYSGNIGTGTLSGTNDNIALVLASTNTGTLNLTRLTGNTYTGGTTIGGGKLIAASDPSASATGLGAVAVNNGGTLGGNGGVGGAITVASGGHIAPGLAAGTLIGTLTSSGGATLNSGSRLDIDLGAPDPTVTASASDRLDLPSNGIIVPGAANSIGVNLSDPAGGAAGNGTYRIISFATGQFTGSPTAFFTSSLPNPNSLNGATIAYHLADDSNVVQDGNPSLATRVVAQVSGGPNALLWTGASSAWDTSAANFTNLGTGATGVAFAGNDNVTFDDTGSTTTVAVDAGGVQPNIVTIKNDSVSYSFSGGDIKGSSLGGGGGLFLSGTGAATISNNYTAAGPIVSNRTSTGTTTMSGVISAATGVTVNGGTLTLSGANTYTSSNTINGGTLSVGADNNLGAAPGSPTANSIVLNGGTLATTNTFTLNSNRSINASTGGGIISNGVGTTLTYGGVISGTGSVTQSGGGTLLLTGVNTYTGNTVVRGGIGADASSTLKIGADNALPTATQLNFNGVVSGGNATFDLNGFNQTVNGIALTPPTGVTGAGGTITNSAAGSAKNFTVNNSNTSAAKTFAGVVSGNLNLVKNGTGLLTLTGANTYTGDTKDLGGTLSISSAYLADAADVYLATGSLFNLNFAATDTIRSLFIDGLGQATGTWGGTGSGAAHITSLISGTGILNVTIATSLTGDYNNDGKVDAGDYVTWRKNPGAFGGPAGYTTWRANFGNGAGSGSILGGASAVPEPATLLLSLLIIGSTLAVSRGKR